MDSFLHAVAREEGFFVTGSRPARNNNPGDLEYNEYTKAHGALKGDPRFAVFPNPVIGFLALRALFMIPARYANGKLVAGYLGATISDAFNRYAPPIENNTNRYTTNVCLWTGYKPTDFIISDMLEVQNAFK